MMTVYDEVTGRKIKKSILNQEKVSKYELDDYMLEDCPVFIRI